jgi:anti-anti-sigma factor
MQYEIKPHRDVRVVHLTGELNGESESDAKFVADVRALLSKEIAGVVLDVGGVPYMNSTGLSELVNLAAQGNVQECRVVLANPSAFVEGVLNTTQLARFFEMHPTVDAAVAQLSSQ